MKRMYKELFCTVALCTAALSVSLVVCADSIVSNSHKPTPGECIPALTAELYEVEWDEERYICCFGDNGKYWSGDADDAYSPLWSGSWSAWKSKRFQGLWLRVCEHQNETGRVCVWETPLRCDTEGVYRGLVFIRGRQSLFFITLRPLMTHEG